MATKKKTWFYVLVMTSNGPVYVTGNKGHVAYWDKREKPLEFSMSWAEDVVIGLAWNGTTAAVVAMPFEIKTQPYRYECGEFKWEEKTNDKDVC